MSNEWRASAKQIGTQFASVVRRVDRAEPYFLLSRGKPILHPCERDAELAAAQHIILLLNTEPRFTPAPRINAGAQIEEQTFGTVTSRRGKKARVRRKRRQTAATLKAAGQSLGPR